VNFEALGCATVLGECSRGDRVALVGLLPVKSVNCFTATACGVE
jgi:hypothetical protein